ncbi:helix-turn-helix transcriptional regulator [Streptomyces sp. x-80]|uniref:helix-turn-helix transcriptional regulator n=1 Tax=Streptomyces sp. x-80 TaxID=2789282 RepID=UPI0039801B5B
MPRPTTHQPQVTRLIEQLLKVNRLKNLPRQQKTQRLPLIGRNSELRLLHALLTEASHGRPAVVLLTGEAGIGKTSLLDPLTDDARRRGFTVGRADGSPLERDFAFGVVRQLFENPLAEYDEQQREALLESAGPAAAMVLRDRGFHSPHGDRGSFATHHALYRLMGSLADRAPLLVTVDDAHLADAPSLRCLSYVVRRLNAQPVLLVLCTTEGEHPHADQALDDLLSAAHIMRLAPLGPDHVQEVVRHAVGGPVAQRIAPACREVTRGNPFLLTELLRILVRQPEPPTRITEQSIRELGSPAVAERLIASFRSCPDAAELAHAVAILGDRTEFALAAELADLAPAAAARALDALVQMKVLQNSCPLAFVHTFVRNAVLDNTLIGRRIASHTKAAELLRQAQAPAERIAAHLLNSSLVLPPWAADVLREAAHLAESRGAPDVAATYLQHALNQPLLPGQRPFILAELGSVELSFAPTQGIGHLRTALGSTADAQGAARVALSLVPALCMASAHQEAVDVADAVLAGLDSQDRDLTWALNAMAMVSQFQRMQTAADARARIEQLSAQLPDSPDLRRSRLAFLAAMNSWRGEARTDVIQYTREALAGADSLFFRPPGYYALLSLPSADEPHTAKELYAAADRFATESGSPRAAAIMAAAHGKLSLAAGDVTQATREFTAALDFFGRDGATTDGDALSCAAGLVEALVPAGRLNEARATLAEWDLLSDELPEVLHHNFVLCARGLLRIAEGDPQQAAADLEECGRRAEVWQMRNPAVAPWRSRAATAHTLLGATDRARKLAEEELAYAHRWNTPRTIGHALHALAMASDGERRSTLLTEAVTALEKSPSRLGLAHALLDFGIHAEENGHRTPALEALRQAAHLAHICGAAPLQARAQHHLTALAPACGTACHSSPYGLTPQEYRVALLAAQGATNRQIAEKLCVTVRAVEFHLSGTYRKIGVKRAGLASALSGDGTSAHGA